VLGAGFKYNGIFSFEFMPRDPQTGNLNGWITEVFLLLAPEEYTIQEGYKVSINKTISNAWVDDFGNDIKTIKLSGSIYSYYVGTIFNSEKVPIHIGISGLDEFFKLRYIVSRFRDTNSQNTNSEIKSVFPEVSQLMSAIGESKASYENIGIVYHDYDDNNHYEVIFTNFTMSRSKNDPFTINYSIEMKTLKEYDRIYSTGIGKIGRKESLNEIFNIAKEKFDDILERGEAIVSLPVAMGKNWNEMLQTTHYMNESIEKFLNGTIDDYTQFITLAMDTKDDVLDLQTEILNIFFSDKIGESIEDIMEKYREEEEDYLVEDQKVINLMALVSENILNLSLIISAEKYTNNLQKKTTVNIENRIITTEQFEKNIINNNVTVNDENSGFVYRDYIYYEVQQEDTLPKIAKKFYSDYEQYNIIAEVNNVTTKDFLDDGMLGYNLMIPLTTTFSFDILSKNLVYYKKSTLSTTQERQIQILGSDFELSNTRDFVTDGSGDIAMLYGQDCYEENILDRIKYKTNTLDLLHPEWGVNIYAGDVPSSIILSRLIDNITKQVSDDPRTQYCFIDKKNINIEEDAVKVNLKYKTYTGNENYINIGDIISKSSMLT
jgi:hypothetical protein